MLLAAGKGSRLRPLTDLLPKPLIKFRGKPLIDYSLEAISAAGIKECVINVFYKASMIEEYVDDGSKWGIKVIYSREDKTLGTGGGVLKALPLLGEDNFLLMNSDIIHDINLNKLLQNSLTQTSLVHLILVDKEYANSEGDFSLAGQQIIQGATATFCGVSIMNPQIFSGEKREVFHLADLYKQAITKRQITGEIHPGLWFDLGTPASMQRAEAALN